MDYLVRHTLLEYYTYDPVIGFGSELILRLWIGAYPGIALRTLLLLGIRIAPWYADLSVPFDMEKFTGRYDLLPRIQHGEVHSYRLQVTSFGSVADL